MEYRMAGNKNFRSPLHTGEISIPLLNKTKNCPYCAEEISSLSRRCSLCGESLKKRRSNALYIAKSRQVEKNGNLALIFSVLGLLLCTILSPGAWFYAYKKEKECHKLRVQVPTNLRAGTILGILGTGMLILFVGVRVIATLVIYSQLGSI